MDHWHTVIWANSKMQCHKTTLHTTKPFTYVWVVVINEVQVDPQLPHTLKGISEPQTENNKTKHAGHSLTLRHIKVQLWHFSHFLLLVFTHQATNHNLHVMSRSWCLSNRWVCRSYVQYDGRVSNSPVQPLPELSQHQRSMMNGLQVPTRHLDKHTKIHQRTHTSKYLIIRKCLEMWHCSAGVVFTQERVKDSDTSVKCVFNWPAESLWCLVGPQWRSWILSPPAAASRHSDLHLRPKPPAALWGRRPFNSAAP